MKSPRVKVLAVLVACGAALMGGCSSSVSEGPSAAAAPPAGKQPTTASNILVSGRAITPAGTTSGLVGGMPQNIIVSPDGKYAITTSSSLDELLCVLRIGDGSVVSSVSYATMGPTVSPNTGLFYGLVFDPVVNPNNTYTLYAAQGPCSQIAVLELAADGTLTQKSTIFCSQFNVPPPVIKPATGYAPAGLALDAQGYLYFTNYIPTDFVSPYAGASTLCIYNTRTQAYVGTYTYGLPGPALKSYGKHNMPSRFSEWNCEFQQMLEQEPGGSKVPHFMTVRFMRDHTMGTNPGFESPVSMIADNDYAVGQLVEAVSKSPIWMSTVIFVIEDDAQFGPDHVDAHRSPCLVISPWITNRPLPTYRTHGLTGADSCSAWVDRESTWCHAVRRTCCRSPEG